MKEMVILVDQDDNQIGTEDKMIAHELGQLHRAFSVFIFNAKGEMLLQQRAYSKYHSGGLWSNACCSHPRNGEPVDQAAHRRLMEELGIDCHLDKRFKFIYHAELDNNLIEHELDHVFIGKLDNIEIRPNPEEVANIKWLKINELKEDIQINPQKYTEWFKIALNEILNHI